VHWLHLIGDHQFAYLFQKFDFVDLVFVEHLPVIALLYQQFALTIAFSIAISTFLALTLTPSLCGVMLRQGQTPPAWINWLFVAFNNFFAVLKHSYGRFLIFLSHFKGVVIGLFVDDLPTE
jgi:multidrug efflux pump subunit AcrB